MKYILILFFFAFANFVNGQNITTGPDLTLSPSGVLNTNLKSRLDSVSIAAKNLDVAIKAVTITANAASTKNVQQDNSLTDLYNKHKQDSIAIANIVVPPTAGIPKPIIKTSSFTVSDSCHGRDIIMKCNNCYVTFPTSGVTPGIIVFVHAPSGRVNFSGTFVESTPTYMTINARPVRFVYETSNQVQGK